MNKSSEEFTDKHIVNADDQSLDGFVQKIAIDYHQGRIQTIQNLTDRLRPLVKHYQDLRNDETLWKILRDIIGEEHTTKLRCEFTPEKPKRKSKETKTRNAEKSPKTQENQITERIQLDPTRASDVLTMADIISLLYSIEETEICLTIINADSGPIILKQYEDLAKFIKGDNIGRVNLISGDISHTSESLDY